MDNESLQGLLPQEAAAIALRRLAGGDLSPADREMVIAALSGSPILSELIDAADRAAERALFISPDEDEGVSSASEPVVANTDPQFQQGREFEEFRVRTAAEARTTSLKETVRSLFRRMDGNEPVLSLVVDGGQFADRAETARVLQEAFAGRALLFSEGDLHLRTINDAREAGDMPIVVIASTAVLSVFGQELAPDAIESVLSGERYTPPTAFASDQAQLRSALDLDETSDATIKPPAGEALNRLLSQATRHREEAALATAVRVFMRARAVGKQPAVRTALDAAWTRGGFGQSLVALTDNTDLTLDWCELLRSLGWSERALEILPNVDNNDEYVGLRAQLQAERIADQPAPGAATPRSIRLSAKAQRNNGDFIGALTTIEQARTLAPHNISVLVEAGIIAGTAANLPLADRYFSQAHRLSPENGAVLNAWGRAIALNGDTPRASRVLEQASTIEPWNPRHWIERAFLARQRGLMRESERLLLPLLSTNDDVLYGRALIELTTTLLDSFPKRASDLDDLFAELEQVLPNDPRVVSLNIKRAYLAGEYERVEILIESNSRFSNNRYVQTQSALALLAMLPTGNRDIYIDRIRRRVQGIESSDGYAVDPISGQVHASLAAHLKLLEFNENASLDRQNETHRDARKWIQDQLEIWPNSAVLLNVMAGIELEIGEQRNRRAASLSIAESILRTSLNADPYNAYTARGMARVLLEQDRPEEARSHEDYVEFAGLASAANGVDGGEE